MKWKLKYILFGVLILSSSVFSKVDPPNYDFSLDKFEEFMPGKKLNEAHRKNQTFSKAGFKTYKIYIEHIRYKFPLFVQVKGDTITDFFARLPAYFLHDIFHQSLINRIGKQDIYKKVEEQAVYIWKNKKGLSHIYSGGCTITCFPIYYSVKKDESGYGDGYVPLMEKLN